MEQSRRVQIMDSPFSAGHIVAIDKPYGWTSFDVVNKFRYILSRRLGVKRIKVGHAGTLDPLATGVVVLCTGKATKHIERLQKDLKYYETQICLGASTPSHDMETEVDREYDWSMVTCESISRALKEFEGDIKQVPPLFSACKVNGKRAYSFAREGKEVELEPKQIFIERIELIDCNLPHITLRVRCGKGTYIRALARDLGQALGCGGYLKTLRRLEVGEYSVDKALSVEEIGEYIENIVSTHLEHQRGEQ